jgi:hypothetical protein
MVPLVIGIDDAVAAVLSAVDGPAQIVTRAAQAIAETRAMSRHAAASSYIAGSPSADVQTATAYGGASGG